jgi:endonuclease/exonuclease/phosphatase family metal-dependent hydrolase
MKLLNRILLFLNLLIVAATLAAYAAPFVNPASFWPFSFFGLIYPYLLLSNIIFIIIWVSIKHRFAFISGFVLIAGFPFVSATVAINKPTVEVHNGIKLMSFNLNQGYYLYENGIEKGELLNFLIISDPDILLLQEYNSDYIKNELQPFKSHPNRLELPQIGTSIYSKFPYINSGEVEFNKGTNSCIWGDFLIGGDTIRIYSVHFQSNEVSKKAEEFVIAVEKERKFETENVKGILRKYKHNVQLRASQVQMVRDHIATSPYPVIIGGDFNDPPVSFAYRQFNSFLTDSFRERGFGTGITYHGVIPFLRIDYIMISKQLEVIDFNVNKVKYSDHYPLETVFRKKI